MMRLGNFGGKRPGQPPRPIRNPRGHRPPPPPPRRDPPPPPPGYNYNGGYRRNRGGCFSRIFAGIAVVVIVLVVAGISVCSRGGHSRAAEYGTSEVFYEEFQAPAAADK